LIGALRRRGGGEPAIVKTKFQGALSDDIIHREPDLARWN
jgi:hypothetical protein